MANTVRTISDLKSDLEGIGHGTSLSKIRNVYNLIQRAAKNVLLKTDPPDTIRISQITNAVHNDIYDYSAPSDLKENAILDIRPQIGRLSSQKMTQRGLESFDFKKGRQTFAVQYNSGEKSLRMSVAISPAPVTIHDMNSITDNGTWAAGGDATNLTQDKLNYIKGNASLNFDLTGAAVTGYIENSTMTAIDLEDQDEIGQIFVRVYIPDTSIITNFILRWGSSTVNYWLDTVTSPHDQSEFKTGWNILRFDWNGATENVAGAVDPSAINYLRLTVTVSVATAETDLRVDDISCSAGKIWEIMYYSECPFRTTAGTWITAITDDTDLINLDEDGYNLLVAECGMAMAQQIQGADGVSDKAYFKEQLYGDQTPLNPGLYAKYIERNPSQRIKKRETYYNMTRFNRSNR